MTNISPWPGKIMSRRPFIGGNWKSNGSISSCKELVSMLNQNKPNSNVEVVVAPTFLHLALVQNLLEKPYQVAAQNTSLTGNGAFTGEISAEQLVDHGIKWVILGHSERRQLYKESDSVVAQKVKMALSKGLSVIACIGETLEERKTNQTEVVCIRQLSAIADSLNISDWNRIVVAYEPVWAIGTGMTATTQQAQDVHAILRSWLINKSKSLGNTRIIYGGSVKANNAQALLSMRDVDGFLVGGASLTKEFVDIIAAAGKNSKL